jgi:HD-like signal output (HDOD) protein
MTTGVQTTDETAAPEEEAAGPSIGDLLELVDQLAARRPVAARVVAMTDDDSVGSKELAGTLTADVALTTRVMKLANSAYFGLGGRVRTVTFAVTVVGFSTIRAMAATAAAGLDTDDVLPADFWPRSKATAVACSSLAPLFGVPAPDAFCLGLLSGLGQAILIQHDQPGYQALLDREDVAEGGRRALLLAEQEVHGFRHTQVSAAALSAWRFPREFTDALDLVDDPSGRTSTTPWSRCLATSIEAAGRLVRPEDPTVDVLALSEGSVTEDRLAAMMPKLHEAVSASDW